MADALIYNLSTKNDYLESVATRKEVVYVQDQNGGSYNGTINIETSSISNSGKFQDLSSAFIVIPYCVQINPPVARNLNGELSRMSVGLKSGYWQIIHSFSCDWNGVNICQLTPYINMYCSFKAMSSWSTNDQFKNGLALGFWKDSVDSMYYSEVAPTAADGPGGFGVGNNLVQEVGNAQYTNQNFSAAVINWDVQTTTMGYNEGLRKRLSNIYLGSIGAVAAVAGRFGQGFGQFMTTANALLAGLNVCDRTANNGYYYWKYNAVIRLKDLSDFFEKVPLCKGGVLRLTINYNSAQQVFSATGASVLNITSTVLTSGQTVPHILTSSAYNNPNAALGAGAASINVVSNLTPNLASNVGQGSINTARLYVPLYSLHPSYEEQLLSLNPVKTIQYKDIYQYTISNVVSSSSQNFNVLITNGLVRPMSVIICPFISTNISGVSNITSPFSTAPATVDPYIGIRNFNVQVSGVNLFQQNIDYSFLEFQQELSRMSAVNGNVTTGLTSGLIDLHDYDRGYGYVVADCSRSYSFDDIVPKSILLSGSISLGSLGAGPTAQNVTLYCFVEYMRTVNINLASGNISL